MKFVKGQIAWNKGIPMSQSQKNHLSLMKIGKPSFPAKPSTCCNCHVQYYKNNGGGRHKDRKYCSFECYSKSRIGKKLPRRLDIVGERNNQWRGNDVNYHTLHKWVNRWLGHPLTCEFCNETKSNSRQLHWANKSHEYKRELSDWLRLCCRCHKKYDQVSKP